LSGVQGALVQMFAHGINAVGLFFIAKIIYSRTNIRDINALGGITQKAPNLTIYFIILMLGSVALPLTNGFVGEFLLLKGVFERNTWLGAIAGVCIILGAVYMLRAVQKSMFGNKTMATSSFQDLTFTEKSVLVPLAILVLMMGLLPNILLKISEPSVQQMLDMMKK
jgi:NADH-quinone oxidoreductase subunit M